MIRKRKTLNRGQKFTSQKRFQGNKIKTIDKNSKSSLMFFRDTNCPLIFQPYYSGIKENKKILKELRNKDVNVKMNKTKKPFTKTFYRLSNAFLNCQWDFF